MEDFLRVIKSLENVPIFDNYNLTFESLNEEKNSTKEEAISVPLLTRTYPINSRVIYSSRLWEHPNYLIIIE